MFERYTLNIPMGDGYELHFSVSSNGFGIQIQKDADRVAGLSGPINRFIELFERVFELSKQIPQYYTREDESDETPD